MKGFICESSAASPLKVAGKTYSREVNVTDHPHNIRDLICSDDASPLALSTYLCRHAVFISFEYSGLVKANGGGVNIHVAKNNVGIRYPSR
jgi:hypothetical protein